MSTAVNVEAEVAAMSRMRMTDLKARYAEVFGEPTRSGNRQFMIKRVVWRLQARAEGDLSERARKRAMELADEAALRTTAPKVLREAPSVGTLTIPIRSVKPAAVPLPGTLLVREYKGRKVVVKVLVRGYEFEGKVHRSLSSIANEVTGGHWSGTAFFGVGRSAKRQRSSKETAA